MIIFLKENDREVVSTFLNKQVGGVEVFYPSVTNHFLIEGDKGSRVFIPNCIDDVYMVNGILCRSILSVVKELTWWGEK